MAYQTTQTYDPNPNTLEVLEVATSFNPRFLDEEENEAGRGSLVNRDMASDILKYHYSKYPFDQLYQLFSGFDTTSTGKWEFFETDALLPYVTEGVAEDATDVINNPDGTNTYVPASEARYVIDSDKANIFSVYDIVRYEDDSGDYYYGWVTDIGPSNSGVALTITSIDGEDIPAAADATARVERIAPNLPQDLDYVPQPKHSDPVGYIAYTQNYRREIAMTRKFEAMNNSGGTIADLIDSYAEELTLNFRRDRETDMLLGAVNNNIITLPNSDKAQFQAGLYMQTRADNLHTAPFRTNGNFDADLFKDAWHEYVLRNFGGESGGPQEREFICDPLFQSYFDRAWEDKQRYFTNEYVAGVSVTTFKQTNKAVNIFEIPSWSEIHPIPQASLRHGSAPRAAGMMFPLDPEHLVRIQQEGLGPRQEVFRLNGGDRTMYQRIESNESAVRRLRQHWSVFEEELE